MRTNDRERRQLSEEELETDSAGQSGDISAVVARREADSESTWKNLWKRAIPSKHPSSTGVENAKDPDVSAGLHRPSARGRCAGRISQRQRSATDPVQSVSCAGRPKRPNQRRIRMSKTYEHYRVRLTITKEPRISSREAAKYHETEEHGKRSSPRLSRARACAARTRP